MTRSDRWFNRFLEYWILPSAEAVVDHVRRGRVQLVQVGNFGPDFYSTAHDGSVPRSWPGMPLVGIGPNLERAAQVIARIRETGVPVVGQLSMTLHFGDHEGRVGLFGEAWTRMWSPEVLGAAPCAAVDGLLHLDAQGRPEARTVEGRPYRSYRGCVRNPDWLTVLKAMVTKGLDLGLDGFNATHNYESFCRCRHCAGYLRAHLEETGVLDRECLLALFGTDDPQGIADPLAPAQVEAPVRRRYEAAVEQAAAKARKDAFDEVFIAHGRQRRPDLWLAQWYHKYGLRVHDERAGLPAPRWAAGEDYIWYSQGPYRWGSGLEQGYLADMGLPARFMHAAGGGRPFVVNKYDYRRWRVWAAEAAAHGGAALAFHAGPPPPEQTAAGLAPEDYYGPVIRAQRFMADQEPLLHPATPWSQVGLVYPRRQERDAEPDCLDAFKRIGEWLEDAHVLFDAVLDEQLEAQARRYEALVLPEIERLTPAQVAVLEERARDGAVVVVTEATGRCDEDGSQHRPDPLARWRPPAGAAVGVQALDAGHVLGLRSVPWKPRLVPIPTLDGVELPVFPRLPDDEQGQLFIDQLRRCLGGLRLVTDAPWYVRVRAWRPEAEPALVVHWINYLQDELAAVETPIPIGPIAVEVRCPEGLRVGRVEWRYPEMKAPEELAFEQADGIVRFHIRRLIVHGMSVLRLAGDGR